jgi:glycosyltransferase involved in cell wall biosynthesis
LPSYVDWRQGFVGDDAAVELFRRCAVVALPYRDASQSALIPAAYYFRKPVVATSAGALPEYVEEGETGLIIEPGNPDQLAAAIREFILDAKRGESMGMKGREWYDSRRIEEARALFDLYASLALSNGK